MPSKDDKLGNAPPNSFMPKPENLVNMKKEREVAEIIGKPSKICENGVHELWFKQDDTFQ